MKFAVAQLNPRVGDIEGNLNKLIQTTDKIDIGSADLLITPELYLCGYPPKDLLGYEWFLQQLDMANKKLLELSSHRPDLALLVGTVCRSGKRFGKGLYNSAILLYQGEEIARIHKQLLPTYDVFDEDRYFDEGPESSVINFKGKKLGISICEDAWNDPDFERTHEYELNPIEELAKQDADIFINLSASPYHRGKEKGRFRRFAFHAKKWQTPFAFVAQTGANDELIFDGTSLFVDDKGKLVHSLKSFEEDLHIFDTDEKGSASNLEVAPEIEEIRQALVLGVRDYLHKSGFKNAILGLSGGIDSALTACIAVEAIGAENVRTITMPSYYSSEGSVSDSMELAKNLGIICDQIPIADPFDSLKNTLKTAFSGHKEDVTEENIQARIRGTLLMAYANKFGGIVLTTGNKSEMAVGYCTLYGDMNGGLAVISDLPKTTVYELSRWYNREKEVIPQAIINKAPSAELRPDQKDEDSLPPYDVLDDILQRYLNDFQSKQEIIEAGYDEETVTWVLRAVDRNEYKRKQAAPGLRVTTKAFGSGRRMPIAAKWKL